MPNIHAIIQARMTSTRLPGKVLLPGYNKSMLEHLVERLQQSQHIQKVIVATTINQTDDPIIELCEKLEIGYHRGSENDVLQRVLDTMSAHDTDIIVEITGDCPLIDYNVVDDVINTYLNNSYDYVSNVMKRTYPRGLDTQVFSKQVLEKVNTLTKDPMDREHVSLYIYKHPQTFSCHGISLPTELSHPDYRWTLDTPEDYEFIKTVFEKLYPTNPKFTFQDIYKLISSNPELTNINKEIKQKTINYYE
jgi:spore coat polysaccharide biosynthesis protein SpsF